jgi:hypothetical protein
MLETGRGFRQTALFQQLLQAEFSGNLKFHSFWMALTQLTMNAFAGPVEARFQRELIKSTDEPVVLTFLMITPNSGCLVGRD